MTILNGHILTDFMYKYDGLIVYESHDDDGILEIVEQNGLRSLHFGSPSQQSCFQPNAPDKLVLDYVRAMMAWLLFKAEINRVLLIGLGGGSLARFLLQNFPDCRLTAVEYRRSVVRIARSYFALPLDNRLKIIIGDGGRYCRQHGTDPQQQFSLLLIDAFDHENMSTTLSSMAFFDACRNLLEADGVLVINLWNTDKALFSAFVQWLREAFDDKILLLPVKDNGNVIALAFNADKLNYRRSVLRSRAAELEAQYGIEFSKFFQAIARSNDGQLHRVINT